MTKIPIRRVPLLLYLLLAASPALGQGEQQVTGKVVDQDGKPVAGATVANYWDSGANEHHAIGVMVGFDGCTTDAEGRFRYPVEAGDRPTVLMVIDGPQKLGGLLTVDSKSWGASVSITVTSLVEVRGCFSCDEVQRPPSWTNVYIEHKASGSRFLQCDSRAASFAFKLPPGEYDFDGYGSGVHGIGKVLELSAEQPVLDLGTIDLRATGINKHTGKEPPELHVTDARGVAKTVKYSDFKGKWLLIEFWGFW